MLAYHPEIMCWLSMLHILHFRFENCEQVLCVVLSRMTRIRWQRRDRHARPWPKSWSNRKNSHTRIAMVIDVKEIVNDNVAGQPRRDYDVHQIRLRGVPQHIALTVLGATRSRTSLLSRRATRPPSEKLSARGLAVNHSGGRRCALVGICPGGGQFQHA